MVEIFVKKPTKELEHQLAKNAVKVEHKPMFIGTGHTREAKELSMAKSARHTTEKKLTPSQYGAYNRILEEQRHREEGKIKRQAKKKIVKKPKKENLP